MSGPAAVLTSDGELLVKGGIIFGVAALQVASERKEGTH